MQNIICRNIQNIKYAKYTKRERVLGDREGRYRKINWLNDL